MLAFASERHQFAETITCNSGIKLLPTPTCYVSVDMISHAAFREEAIAAQQQGTRLVTLKRRQDALKDRGVEHFDDFILEGQGEPQRGKWGTFRYSGPFCLELACHRGAKTVVLVGMCGWTKVRDYFDADTHPHCRQKQVDSWQQQMTREHLKPRTQNLVTAWHDVEFICYGEPTYRIEAPNWRVIEP